MRLLCYLFFAFTLFYPSPALALEPVSDQSLEPVLLNLDESEERPSAMTSLSLNVTKTSLSTEELGNHASIITREQIRQTAATSLQDVLRRVAGIDVIQSGTPGNTASFFIRGMNAEHTLFLIDGMEANDPISPGRTFNFSDQIALDCIDHIEILRGPHSTLYGSDAMGGVINIVTETGQGRPILRARVQAGSYGTLQEDVSLRGGSQNGRVRFTLHGTRQDINGFSSAGQRYGNHEKDAFKNTALGGTLRLQPLPNASLSLHARYADSKTELDNFGGFGGDDPNYIFKNKTLYLGGQSRITLFQERLEQITRISYSKSDRKNINEIDVFNPSDSEESLFQSQLFKLDVQNNLHLGKWNTLTGGVEISNEWGEFSNRFDSMFGPFVSEFSERTATNAGFYLQDHIKVKERLFTTLGLRLDNHNRFGNALTYRVASTFLVHETGTRLNGSYGTGFKAPTLYQLYSSFGDTDLQAEESQGWDLGVEQNLYKGKIKAGATYFHNNIENMIQFEPVLFVFQNLGHAKTEGSEVYIEATPKKWLNLRASYTALKTRDLETELPLLRRPKHKMAFNIHIQPCQKMAINLDILHVGQREDLDFASFPATRGKLSAYTLINMALHYQLSKKIKLFGRLQNLLDTPYEDVKGFGTPRISAYGGLELEI